MPPPFGRSDRYMQAGPTDRWLLAMIRIRGGGIDSQFVFGRTQRETYCVARAPVLGNEISADPNRLLDVATSASPQDWLPVSSHSGRRFDWLCRSARPSKHVAAFENRATLSSGTHSIVYTSCYSILNQRPVTPTHRSRLGVTRTPQGIIIEPGAVADDLGRCGRKSVGHRLRLDQIRTLRRVRAVMSG